MTWLTLAGALAIAAIGWGAHQWWCIRRNGCPVWRERKTRTWTNMWERYYPTRKYERRPSAEVETPGIEEKKDQDPWPTT